MSTQPVNEKFKKEEDDTSSLHDIPLTPPKPQQHHTVGIANIPHQPEAEPQEHLPSPETLSEYFTKHGLLIGWLKDFAPQALKVEAVPFDDNFKFISRDIECRGNGE